MARRLARLADAVGVALFALLFASVIVQVVLRFAFGAPAAWTEELAAIAFVWAIFWGAAFTVPLAAHVAVDFVPARCTPCTRRALYALGLIVLAACFAWALPGIADYLRFMLRERTPVLDLPVGAVYAVFLAFAAMVVVRALAQVLRPAQAAGTAQPGDPA